MPSDIFFLSFPSFCFNLLICLFGEKEVKKSHIPQAEFYLAHFFFSSTPNNIFSFEQ